jgi:hypothetical protein
LIIPTLNLFIKRESHSLAVITVRAYTPGRDGTTFTPASCRELVARHVGAAASECRDIIQSMEFANCCSLLDELESPTFLAVFTE